MFVSIFSPPGIGAFLAAMMDKNYCFFNTQILWLAILHIILSVCTPVGTVAGYIDAINWAFRINAFNVKRNEYI